MAKRGSVNLGLVSMVIAVVGAAGLAACGSDDDSGAGGAGGTSGSSAGKGGGGATAGSSGSHAGATNVAGTSAGGESAGGAAGENPGAAGEAGTPSGGSPAGGASTGGAGNGGGGASNTGGGGNGGGAGAGTDQYKPFSPLPALPADTTNAFADSAAAATFGQKLFFDKRYSGPLIAVAAVNPLGAVGDTGKVACATCHLGPAMSDHRDPFNVTLGTNFHTRNAPALVNSSFYTWTNWAGRFSAQWELPLAVAENPLTMNSNRLKLAHFIYDHYKADYEAVFATTLNASLASGAADAARFPAQGKPKAAGGVDGPWESMTSDDQKVVNRIIVNFGKALQAYFRKLVSRDAPFDQYVANGGNAISDSAKRGADLFIGKANCVLCHTGPAFTDNKFHNLGVRQDATVLHEPATDNGRFADGASLLASTLNSSGAYSDDAGAGAARLTGLSNPMPDSTKAAFRTASLREVADTAPYMHSGQIATLADVVKFYVAGGGTVAAGTTKDPLLAPLTLSDAEQADLVEFMKTLSGAAVPAALLVDTSGQ